DLVNIWAQNTQFKKYFFKEKNIKVNYLYNSFYWKKEDKPKNFANKVKKKINFSENDWFVAIDESSLEPALDITQGKNVIYLSLELPNSQKTYTQNQTEMFNKVKAVIVQDTNRLNTLKQAYKAEDIEQKAKIIFIPNNSVMEKSQKNITGVVEQFKNLPKGKTILASIGMIEAPVYSLEIARVFEKIDNAVLIYHNRMKINKKKPYTKQILEANSKNLYLSNMVYDFEDIEFAYKGIDIGIACYRPMNDDFKFIGKASGKLNYYLAYNIPVIVNRLEGLSDIVEKYNCGVVIDDVESLEEWQNAIDKITKDMEGYKIRTRECYLKEFDFEEKIKPLEDFLLTSFGS
ncbi:hypothetical protein IJ670_04150, partial [bacterium]|nr:hypothetical protein [bacterium]